MKRKSWAYDLKRARLPGEVAVGLGLARKVGLLYQDARTGRGVTTRLAELARLPIDWTSPAGQEWLRTVWEAVCSTGRRTVRQWVRWLLGCTSRRTHPSRRSPARLSSRLTGRTVAQMGQVQPDR